MEIATLRNMSKGELKTELEKQARVKFGLRQGLKMGEVKDSAKFQKAKKVVAQIKTLLTEKAAGQGELKLEDKSN